MSIKLSKEHGVNPTILKCPCCGKDTGLALLGKLKGDKKAPPYMYDRELCDECKKTHILVFEVENEENVNDNKLILSEITPGDADLPVSFLPSFISSFI